MAAKPPVRTKKKRRPNKNQRAVVGGKTYPGLPYYSLDKDLESYLDQPPSALSRLPAAGRARLAIKLRIAGATWEQVSDKLGYASASSAYNSVKKHIQRLYDFDEDFVGEVVQLDLARLDAMQLVLWEKATRHGDVQAVDRILRVMEMRHKLLGVGQRGGNTTNINVEGETPQVLVISGDTEDEYVARLKELRGETQSALPSGNGKARTSDA